jgi:hypothetical protein
MSEITVNRKTFHQYLILDEIKIPKEDVIKEFGSVKEFQLQVPFREKKTENFIKKYKILSTKKDNYTERTDSGYAVEYDMFDGDKIIVKNNMGI